jgi:uncharacterized protein YbjT (DUF2867 family)
MKVLLFGATGMVGQGVLRECLLDPSVDLVLSIGRTDAGMQHLKLRDVIQPDLFHYESIEAELAGYDACFFCLGVSSSGMDERDYARITYGITLAAAQTLCRINPRMTFVYVSGAGTDSSERGRSMWARVKGKTENALLRLPFAAAFMFRPGIIEALDGIRSKTKAYRVIYSVAGPLLPLVRFAFPKYVLTTRQIGRAMLAVAKRGFPKRILETSDIRAAAAS